jgi:hypothetical protein
MPFNQLHNINSIYLHLYVLDYLNCSMHSHRGLWKRENGQVLAPRGYLNKYELSGEMKNGWRK